MTLPSWVLIDLVANSTPIVDLDSRLNSFRVNRDRRLDLPTPESPIRTTVDGESRKGGLGIRYICKYMGDDDDDATPSSSPIYYNAPPSLLTLEKVVIRFILAARHSWGLQKTTVIIKVRGGHIHTYKGGVSLAKRTGKACGP